MTNLNVGDIVRIIGNRQTGVITNFNGDKTSAIVKYDIHNIKASCEIIPTRLLELAPSIESHPEWASTWELGVNNG